MDGKKATQFDALRQSKEKEKFNHLKASYKLENPAQMYCYFNWP